MKPEGCVCYNGTGSILDEMGLMLLKSWWMYVWGLIMSPQSIVSDAFVSITCYYYFPRLYDGLGI
jgi:hypothetical protein